jgi:hypothetical protein
MIWWIVARLPFLAAQVKTSSWPFLVLTAMEYNDGMKAL